MPVYLDGMVLHLSEIGTFKMHAINTGIVGDNPVLCPCFVKRVTTMFHVPIIFEQATRTLF